MNDERRMLMPMMSVRKLVGFLGLTFPAILVLGHLIFVGPAVLPSISDYYHSGMRDVFVGVLFAMALALLVYRGHGLIDDWTANLACGAAICTALLPTDAGTQRTTVGILHLVSAAVFLLTLAAICLFLFPRTDQPAPVKASKKRRNGVFIGCGWTIVACLAGCVLYLGLLRGLSAVIDACQPVLILECVAVMAFGVSWLVKGQTIFADLEPR